MWRHLLLMMLVTWWHHRCHVILSAVICLSICHWPMLYIWLLINTNQLIIIIIPCHCLWYWHHGRVIVGVYPVNFMNVPCELSQWLCHDDSTINIIIRSTSESRPNSIEGKNVRRPVRPYVRPSTKSFFNLNESWYIGRGRWVMHDDMPYGRIEVKLKVTSPSKFEFLPFSKSISSAIYNGSWQMTTNS